MTSLRASLALTVLSLFALGGGRPEGPGTYDLSWNTVDDGGGTSTGGSYEISGTIGQPDAGGPMTGGNFSLTGGFWPGPSKKCLGDIAPPGGNGLVNAADLLAVINGWGACPPPCPPNCSPDVNDDCTVNTADLLAIINAWGPCP